MSRVTDLESFLYDLRSNIIILKKRLMGKMSVTLSSFLLSFHRFECVLVLLDPVDEAITVHPGESG